jgi:hypothetical protein
LVHLLDSSVTEIDLGKFSSTAGHALVEYLYAGFYDVLRTGPVDPSLDVGVWELKAQLEIWSLAQIVGYDELEKLAGEDIENVACGLDVFTVLDAVQAADPSPVGNSTWFPRWIRSYLEEAFEDPRQLLEAPSAPGDRASLVGILLECMLETYADRLESFADQNVAAAQPPPPQSPRGPDEGEAEPTSQAAPETDPDPGPEEWPTVQEELGPAATPEAANEVTVELVLAREHKSPSAVDEDEPAAWEGADALAGSKTSEKGKEKVVSALLEFPANASMLMLTC